MPLTKAVNASPVLSELSHDTSMLQEFPMSISLESHVMGPVTDFLTFAMMSLTAVCALESVKTGGADGPVECDCQLTTSIEALKLMIVAS